LNGKIERGGCVVTVGIEVPGGYADGAINEYRNPGEKWGLMVLTRRKRKSFDRMRPYGLALAAAQSVLCSFRGHF